MSLILLVLSEFVVDVTDTAGTVEFVVDVTNTAGTVRVCC